MGNGTTPVSPDTTVLVGAVDSQMDAPTSFVAEVDSGIAAANGAGGKTSDPTVALQGTSKQPPGFGAFSDPTALGLLLAAIVESSDDIIVSKTLDGTVTSWNKAAEHVLGYTAEEMIGQPITRIACQGKEDDLALVMEKVRRGERVDHYETRRRCKDGREVDVSVTVSPIRDSTGKIIGASKVARDITRQKLAEAALQREDRLALAGRMAASIAHEINNPLEAVTNLLYLLEREALGEQARRYLEQAQHEVSRVSHISAQTLGFFRAGSPTAAIAVSKVVDDALALHRGRFATSNIEVEKKYAAVADSRVNQGELREVLANLVANAADAMPQGGRLKVRVRSATDFASNRQGVRITVADAGQGMSAETHRRLFESFFTTKELTGTGLGLWVSREIITRHGGKITVRSRQSPHPSGSVFAIFLPA